MAGNRRWAGVATAGVVLLAGCRGGPTAGFGPAGDGAGLQTRQAADVQVALARTVESRGEIPQAIEFYQAAARNDPSRADIPARLAVLCDKQGRFGESADYHRRARLLDPNNPDLYCNLGYSLYLQEQWAEAESALRTAVALAPAHHRAQNNLGLVLVRSGRAAEARECFTRAGCSPADAHLNIAYALTLSEAFAEARQHYQAALSADPGSAAAQRGLAQVAALTGRPIPAPAGPAVVQAGATEPVRAPATPTTAVPPPTAPPPRPGIPVPVPRLVELPSPATR